MSDNEDAHLMGLVAWTSLAPSLGDKGSKQPYRTIEKSPKVNPGMGSVPAALWKFVILTPSVWIPAKCASIVRTRYPRLP
jgi:hypothetical protein